MTDPTAEESTGVLLGRPFLSTAGTVIDVGKGTMHLDFNEERLTFSIDKDARKPQERESIQSVDTADPRVQKYLGEEFLKKTSTKYTADEQLEKEAAEWIEATMTGGMDDKTIEKAIMDFCKPPQPVESNGVAQPAGSKKPPDQGTPVGSMLKESPAPARQLLPLPESPVTLKNLSKQMHQEPVDPGPCLHSTMIKGVTPYLDQQGRLDPTMRGEELAVGQKELFFQYQPKLMPERRKSKWADPCATVGPNGEIKLEGGDHDSPPLLVNKLGVKSYRDKTRVGMVEEIPPLMHGGRNSTTHA